MVAFCTSDHVFKDQIVRVAANCLVLSLVLSDNFIVIDTVDL